MTVYIPIPEGLEALAYAGKLTVVRVEENGNYTQMDVSVDAGCLTFTTDHFSLYAVVEYEAEETDSRETDDSSFGIWIFTAAAIALLAAGGAVALVLKKKKAK